MNVKERSYNLNTLLKFEINIVTHTAVAASDLMMKKMTESIIHNEELLARVMISLLQVNFQKQTSNCKLKK